MGDEVRRTQRGNNNVYCQDNEISWFDWSLLEKHQDIHQFVKTLIQIRHRRTEPILSNLTLNQLLARARIKCHGVKLLQPDWNNQSHSLAISLSAVAANLDVYLMLNAIGNHYGSSCHRIPKMNHGRGDAGYTRFLNRPMTSAHSRTPRR